MPCDYLPMADRREALVRADYHCQKCGVPAPRQHPLWCGLQVHHRVGVGNGGGHSAGNLEVLCRSCHDKQPRAQPVQGQQSYLQPTAARYPKRITAFLDDELHDVAEELARGRHMKVAALVRALLREEARRTQRRSGAE